MKVKMYRVLEESIEKGIRSFLINDDRIKYIDVDENSLIDEAVRRIMLEVDDYFVFDREDY